MSKIIRAYFRADGFPGPLTKSQENEMKRVWSDVPHVRCKGDCWDSCVHVPIAPVEALYLIEKLKINIPVGHHALPLMERDHVSPTLGSKQAGLTQCEFLDEHRQCTIYEDRPLVCRQYGHPVMTLHCKHGCEVKRPLTDEKAGEQLYSMSLILGTPREKQTSTWLRRMHDPRSFDSLTQQYDKLTVTIETDD